MQFTILELISNPRPTSTYQESCEQIKHSLTVATVKLLVNLIETNVIRFTFICPEKLQLLQLGMLDFMRPKF